MSIKSINVFILDEIEELAAVVDNARRRGSSLSSPSRTASLQSKRTHVTTRLRDPRCKSNMNNVLGGRRYACTRLTSA